MYNKLKFFLIVLLFIGAKIFAQNNQQPNNAVPPAPADNNANSPAEAVPNSNDTSIDLSQYKLQMLDDFENAELWEAEMPRSNGVVSLEKRDGPPKSIQSEQNKYILGMKVSFFKRGNTGIALIPSRPIVIKDTVKGFSVWAVGRGLKHKLNVFYVEPVKKTKRILSLGLLAYYGWQKMEAPLPESFDVQDFQDYFKRQPDIKSEDKKFSSFTAEEIEYFRTLSSSVVDSVGSALTVEALYLSVDPMSARGTYYMYLDNFEARVDSSIKDAIDQKDNVIDNW